MKKYLIWIETAVGLTAIALFFVMYIAELLPHHGPPVTIRWIRAHLGRTGLILLNIAVVLAFLLLLRYRRPTRNVWVSRGAFIAFFIALMTEMFGYALIVYLASSFVGGPSHLTERYFEVVGHWGAVAGTLLSLGGIALIALGWYKIHRATGLVTEGIYRYMRHPQYTGIFLFTTGWLFHWPTVITLILYPLVIGAYVWLARYEEKQLITEFGDAYRQYAQQVKRFIPGVV